MTIASAAKAYCEQLHLELPEPTNGYNSSGDALAALQKWEPVLRAMYNDFCEAHGEIERSALGFVETRGADRLATACNELERAFDALRDGLAAFAVSHLSGGKVR